MNHQPTISHFENIRLRPTKITDISFILGAEQDPTNALFIKQWTREEHVSALEDPNIRHWVIEAIDATSPLGHIIANGFCNTNRKIYLKRIVITIKDQGYGRQALRAFHHIVFHEFGFNFIWLCVYPQNMRARYLYQSEGYTEIGLSPKEKHIMMALEK